MRGNPITGAARGVSITDAVERGQRILEERPEPRGRERYAGRTNRPPRPAPRSTEGDDAREDGAGETETNGEET
ncbi:hypothetical protein [Salinarimonas rosea]|uniref:hypothetical protein n=1 Tax=Salinarimonas rosea TaxID=552063 RepID=UPI000407EB07|nr:hypothetical protein [Salinarimonas rosea]